MSLDAIDSHDFFMQLNEKLKLGDNVISVNINIHVEQPVRLVVERFLDKVEGDEIVTQLEEYQLCRIDDANTR
jgi:hypothetical protein